MNQSQHPELLTGYVDRLKAVFRQAPSKHEAHSHSGVVMDEMVRDPAVLTESLRKHISHAGALNTRHFPVVAFEVESNAFFDLVLNCWIPLPDRATDVSTKAIHHHGPMLLTTGTTFGPGYEHWMLARPRLVDPAQDLFEMEHLGHGQHALHEVVFVDGYTAHVPIYPESLTITICLWSNSRPTTWKDKLKRVPVLRRNSVVLRRALAKAGLARSLDLKVDDYTDYHPSPRGFVGMKNRDEFPRSTNEDYLYSLFNIIQATGNADLADAIEREVEQDSGLENPSLVQQLIRDLREDTPIEARLSPGHYGVAHANFTTADIEQALAAQSAAA